MRAFVAIDLPPDAAAALAHLQERLRIGRKVDPDSFHVTLAFLGEDVADEPLEALHDQLCALQLPPFPLEIRGVSTQSAAKPAVIVADVVMTEALETLQARVSTAARRAGITLEKRKFRPHVTLARLKRGLGGADLEKLRRGLEAEARFRLDPFEVRSLALYQSTLTHDGPIYEELARYVLTGASASLSSRM